MHACMTFAKNDKQINPESILCFFPPVPKSLSRFTVGLFTNHFMSPYMSYM